MDFRTDSYTHWLLVVLPPALVVGVLNESIVPALVTAVVLAVFAYLYFTYPF